MKITPLGAGNEVGRSCHILKYKGKTIMVRTQPVATHPLSHTHMHTRLLTPCSLLSPCLLAGLAQFDCGIHPGNQGQLALPYLDTVDLKTVDILFISHFHLDHAAGVPYLYTKTDFKGKMFATRPTKAIMHLLLGDYMRVLQPTTKSSCVTYWSRPCCVSHSHSLPLTLAQVSNVSTDEQLYDEADLKKTINAIQTVGFNQTLVMDGVKFQYFNAGHVLGAAMIHIEIAGARVMYTGDYSCEEDRHLKAAEAPPDCHPHVLITESTWGVQVQQLLQCL